MRKSVALCLIFTILFYLPLYAQSVNKSANQVEQNLLNVSLGLFDHVDQGILYLAIDKEKKNMEKIDLDKVKAVFIIQGNNGKLLKYIFGGSAAGGGLGLGTLAMKNKVVSAVNGTENKFEGWEVITYTTVAVAAGAIWGYFKSHGGDKEGIRMLRIYDLEVEQIGGPGPGRLNYKDKSNIEKIRQGSFIQVVITPLGD